MSLDSGYEQGDKAPEGSCMAYLHCVCDHRWRYEMEPFWLTAVLMPLPHPLLVLSSHFLFSPLSGGGSHEGLVKTQLGLHPLTSLFLGLTGIQVIPMWLVVRHTHLRTTAPDRSWKLRAT